MGGWTFGDIAASTLLLFTGVFILVFGILKSSHDKGAVGQKYYSKQEFFKAIGR